MDTTSSHTAARPAGPGLAMDLEFLGEDQNATFDQDYHTAAEFDRKIGMLQRLLPAGPVRILDLGGGNGRFLDDVLDRLPQAQGTLLDISSLLLSKNRPHPRKTLVHGSVEALPSLLPGAAFDVIVVNWVLHHFVGPTYEASIGNVRSALSLARAALKPTGVLVVAEIMMDGFGGNDVPSRVIYGITSARNPLVVGAARRWFNTAGVGVCFHSQSGWEQLFDECGFITAAFHPGELWVDGPAKRLALASLGIASRRNAHYFLWRRPTAG